MQAPTVARTNAVAIILEFNKHRMLGGLLRCAGRTVGES